MSLLGYSQPTLVQYLISLSKKASSPFDIFSNLKDMGVPSSNETRAFAEEIFQKGAGVLKQERRVKQKASHDKSDDSELTEQKLSKREEEEAIRRANALEDDDIGALRKGRRKNWRKSDNIDDEQYLFGDVKLSEAEQRELRYKKQIYELVKKRSQEDDNVNEYRMPDAYYDDEHDRFQWPSCRSLLGPQDPINRMFYLSNRVSVKMHHTRHPF
ncbi:hypothetical protein L2E82_41270 [Cichorium intybus]|uniref:Uncharacterized protein n=1 Tax=Cichorium intybus TaxID=13427 RepID=A0ACB9AMM1_CICIN|nr:hypothetical protein L2E82_41270 [Cichorium intybus]